MKIFKQATYIRATFGKPLVLPKLSTFALLRFFVTEDSLKIKKGLELVSRLHFFKEFFDKKIYFVILHKLTKFRYQTVFTSQVIQ